MTRACPQEVNVNGWNHGPSCAAPRCGLFEEAPSAEARRQTLLAELAGVVRAFREGAPDPEARPMNPTDEAADPFEMCLRCRGAGCAFCDGEGQVPYGAQQDEAERLQEEDDRMAWEEGRP